MTTYSHLLYLSGTCANPQGVSGVVAGTYIVSVEQSGGRDKDYCVKEIAVYIKGKAKDYCKSLTAVGGVEEITVTGVHARWNRIQYRKDGHYARR